MQPAGPVSALRLDVPTLLVANVRDHVMLQVTMQVWSGCLGCSDVLHDLVVVCTGVNRMLCSGGSTS